MQLLEYQLLTKYFYETEIFPIDSFFKIKNIEIQKKI